MARDCPYGYRQQARQGRAGLLGGKAEPEFPQ